MTSLKPLFQSTRGDSIQGEEASSWDVRSQGRDQYKETESAAYMQVMRFQYSIPYTLEAGRTHARTMDCQWKRTTTLTVKEPFPGIFTRQLVVHSQSTDLSPIEVSLEDIAERTESMKNELELGTDNQNLMRLVQGTVMTQVNAGVAEVAKVFLSEAWLESASQMHEQWLAYMSTTEDSISSISGASCGSKALTKNYAFFQVKLKVRNRLSA